MHISLTEHMKRTIAVLESRVLGPRHITGILVNQQDDHQCNCSLDEVPSVPKQLQIDDHVYPMKQYTIVGSLDVGLVVNNLTIRNI